MSLHVSPVADIGAESIQLLLTTPPHWRLKDYNDSPEQLGHVAGKMGAVPGVLGQGEDLIATRAIVVVGQSAGKEVQ